MENDLGRSLSELRSQRTDLTVQQQARLAGLSSTTLIAIRNGKFAGRAQKGPFSVRQRMAWAEALARVQQLVRNHLENFDVPFERIAEQFGLDPADEAVSGAPKRISEAGRSQQPTPYRSADPVAAEFQHAKQLAYAVLNWPPFVEKSEKPEGSWAGRFMQRLLGTILPTSDKFKAELIVPTHAIEGIEEALSILNPARRTSREAPHVSFGIYDHPSRRFSGHRFLNLPGFAVPLAAVEREAGRHSWWDIVGGSAMPDEVLPMAFRGEVGDLYLTGPLGYPQTAVRSLWDYSYEGVANALLDEYSGSDDQFVFFVAEASYCKTLCSRHNKSLSHKKLSFVNPSSFKIPSYKIGMAVRGDADEWADILQHTLREELFGNAPQIMAKFYAELLCKPSSIELISLDDEFPAPFIEKFANYCIDEINLMKNDTEIIRMKKDAVATQRISEIELTWLKRSLPKSDIKAIGPAI